jgi:hypothetical protein
VKGRPPKDPALRQRRNRESTRATMGAEDNAEAVVPELPPREKITESWHPRVIAWWQAVWRSPMASEYLEVDKQGGLYLLAELHQQRWTASDPGDIVEVAKEIRQQEVRFGLSPIDRRRLQWEVEKGEQATERTEKRRDRGGSKADATTDPRSVLKVV